MSNVVKSKRGIGKLSALTKAKGLAVYTIKITANKNVFVPEYWESITSDIVETSKNIFEYLYEANNCDLHTEYELRRKLMNEAIRKCYRLLSLIDMSQPIFHLSYKRVAYWGDMTIEVRNLIRGMKKSDSDRIGK